MLLVVVILLQQQTLSNMRKDNHHILIKNLATNEEQGFMLASGDTPYSVQWVDNVAQRVQDWEILYSDFTNSRVFAQSEWSEWVSRYWDPEKNGFYIFPSKKYKDKKNIAIWEWEFTLGWNVAEEYDIPFVGWEGPMCKGETAWVVYLWSGMQLYRSTDFGNTWSLWKDFTWVAQLSDVNEITDITIIDTETATWPHASPMGTISVWNIQCLFVAFYNRATKASGLARYDISFTIRGSTWITWRSWWGAAFWVVYGTNESSLTVNTNLPMTTSMSVSVINEPSWSYQWIALPWNWWDYGLYPGQPVKMTRTSDWVVYNLTVTEIGWLYSQSQEIWVTWLPNYTAIGSPLQNDYTLEIRHTDTIALSTSTWIWTSFGRWLGQNVIYNGIVYNIYWTSNGIDKYWNIPSYSPRYLSWSADYVILKRIDWWDAYAWIVGNWTQTLNTEKWIYKYGTYNNKITKFVTCEKELTHIWGYNHIDPENKLYDIAYWEMTVGPTYSNIYSNSFNGVLHSLQNHTITFNSWDCPISAAPHGYAEGLPSADTPTIFIGTQFGADGTGTQSSIFELTLKDDVQSAPSYAIKWIVGAAGLTSMVYFLWRLYVGSKKRGMVYEYNNSNSQITELAQLPRDETTWESIIDSMTMFAGKIICSYQKGSGIYTLDPTSRQNTAPLIETDVLCSVDTLSNARIYNICNTGGMLLFTDGDKIYSYDQDGVAEQWYMESSIYGGYISNVDKLWVYAYVRVWKWEIEDWQRVAMEVSLDEGHTWNYLPSVAGKPFSPTNSWSDIYSIDKSSTLDDQQLTFFFPYNTKSGTILYRCWLKKGTTIKPVVNHIGVHYNLNYRQELLFNYQLDLNKSMELLWGRTIEKDLQNDKLAFLKNIWQNQDMVLLTDVNWKTYTCMPFSDDRTPWQGLVISTSNSNTAHLDLNNLSYRVAFSLKTIANYEKTL